MKKGTGSAACFVFGQLNTPSAAVPVPFFITGVAPTSIPDGSLWPKGGAYSGPQSSCFLIAQWVPCSRKSVYQFVVPPSGGFRRRFPVRTWLYQCAFPPKGGTMNLAGRLLLLTEHDIRGFLIGPKWRLLPLPHTNWRPEKMRNTCLAMRISRPFAVRPVRAYATIDRTTYLAQGCVV